MHSDGDGLGCILIQDDGQQSGDDKIPGRATVDIDRIHIRHIVPHCSRYNRL